MTLNSQSRLQSQRHDYYSVGGGGIALHDFPFYMNSMLDRFYIEMLRQAAGIELDS